MDRRIAAVLCAVLFPAGCALGLSDPEPPAPAAQLADVETYVSQIIRDGDPPSVSVSVVDHDRLVYARAFGTADGPRRIDATPSTTYRWFSVTKLFTAVAILQLVEQGRIELDAPAGRYVPLVDEVFGDRARHITIARLLSHSSGLGDVGSDILSWIHVRGPHPKELDVLLRHLATHDGFDAGRVGRGYYSNLGYIILGAVIEAVTAGRYTEHVEKAVLDPLGMSATGFYYDDHRFGPATRHAVGSHPKDFAGFMASFFIDMSAVVRESQSQRYWFNPFYPDQSAPSGLLGPTADAVRFARALLRGGELDGKRLLSSQTVAAMMQPRSEVVESPAGKLAGFSFGYGWFVGRDPRGRKLLVHGGVGMAFTSMLMVWPDQSRAVFVAANGSYLDGAMGQRVAMAYGSLDW